MATVVHLFTHKLVAGSSITFNKEDGYKFVSVYNYSTSTANGKLLGDGKLAGNTASTETEVEAGCGKTIGNGERTLNYIKITAPAGCTLDIEAG